MCPSRRLLGHWRPLIPPSVIITFHCLTTNCFNGKAWGDWAYMTVMLSFRDTCLSIRPTCRSRAAGNWLLWSVYTDSQPYNHLTLWAGRRRGICREQAVRLIRGEIINDVTLVVTRQLAINRNVISVRSGSDTAGQTEIFNQKHTM